MDTRRVVYGLSAGTAGRTLGALVLFCGWALTIGCASIVSSGPDMVSVSSTPEGAKVSLDGVEIGKTPMIVPFERDCEGVLRFELAGYQTKTMDVNKVANGWFVANLLWFPVWPVVPVGMIVDLIGHNQGKYSTRPIRAVLTPMPAPVPAPEPTIEIEP